MPRSSQLVYEPLLRRIRSQVAAGTAAPGTIIGTELDLGRRARISRNSVRTAIDKLVAEGLVERRAGKGIFVREKTTRVIELALPELGGIWIKIARGAQAYAREHGIKLRIFNAHSDFAGDLQAIRELTKSGADGALIGSWHQPVFSRAVVELHQTGFPLVLLTQRLEDFDVPSVITDARQMGYLVGQQLVGRGHRRVGYIGYLAGAIFRQGVDGLGDAFNDHGWPFDRSLLMEMPIEGVQRLDESGDLERCVHQLFDRADPPSALYLGREDHAPRVYQLLRERGLRIPADVSVVSAGDLETSALLDPPLTTLDVHCEECGRVGLELLLKRLQDKQSPVEHRVVPADWIERDSLATRKPAALRQPTRELRP